MSYIGQGLPADTFQGFTTDSFTGDGSATTFTLSKEPFSEDTLIVVINNVIQKPTTNFTVSGTTLTIVGTAVASGDVIYAIHMGGPLPIGGAAELDLNGASDKLILDLDGDTTISADTDDEINIKVGGTDAFNILGSKLIVNDSASHTDDFLQIETPASGGGHGVQIRRNDSNTDQTVGRVQFGNNADVDLGIVSCKTDGATNTGAIVVSTASSGTTAERFRVTEAGIHIGGTADANALDDYEEGTFTPTISNVTFGTDGNVGGYTKVGRHVTIAFYLDIASGTFDTTQLQIGGLPFANGTRECIGSIMFNQLDSGTGYQVMPYLNQGQSIIRLYQSKDSTGWGALATNALSSSTSMFITLNYQA